MQAWCSVDYDQQHRQIHEVYDIKAYPYERISQSPCFDQYHHHSQTSTQNNATSQLVLAGMANRNTFAPPGSSPRGAHPESSAATQQSIQPIGKASMRHLQSTLSNSPQRYAHVLRPVNTGSSSVESLDAKQQRSHPLDLPTSLSQHRQSYQQSYSEKCFGNDLDIPYVSSSAPKLLRRPSLVIRASVRA